jgi:hypothetical protein
MPDLRMMMAAIERRVKIPRSNDERFSGYGCVGLPFQSGHILCLGRWPASSRWQPYTSLRLLEVNL